MPLQVKGGKTSRLLGAEEQAVKLEQVRAALIKLESRGAVEKVVELIRVRTNPALAADPNYQRSFKGYYRMGRRKESFYRHFFSMLRQAASAPSRPSLKAILQELYDKTGERHLSFGTKLLATITDDAVIFDKNVAAHFEVASTALPNHNWLDEALRRHEEIRRGIYTFTQKPEWQQMQALFDQAFPSATHLSEIRKADLIIWAAQKPRGRGVVNGVSI